MSWTVKWWVMLSLVPRRGFISFPVFIGTGRKGRVFSDEKVIEADKFMEAVSYKAQLCPLCFDVGRTLDVIVIAFGTALSHDKRGIRLTFRLLMEQRQNHFRKFHFTAFIHSARLKQDKETIQWHINGQSKYFVKISDSHQMEKLLQSNFKHYQTQFRDVLHPTLTFDSLSVFEQKMVFH